MSPKRPSGRAAQQLRVIGGDWRRSIVQFAHDPMIRPTPNRIRETLFNWLPYDLAGMRVLDPFAGSGILSIEALSRRASHVTILDQGALAVRTIVANLERLGAEANRYTCLRTDAIQWLETIETPPFDLVLLDPPFDSKLLGQSISLLDERQLVLPGSRVYLESAEPLDQISLPKHWHLQRNKKAGGVCYYLCELI